MEKKLILKNAITSAKFGVVFPANTSLNYFKDDVGRIYVEHPDFKNIYIGVSKKNIKSIC